MKKLYTKLLCASMLFSAAILTSCVDSDYDLSKMSDGQFGIGTDETSFDMPLVQVSLDVSTLEITGSEDPISAVATTKSESSLDFSEELDKLDIITALLPNNFGEIDLVQIKADEVGDCEYTESIVDALFDELSSSNAKRLTLCEAIKESESDDYDEIKDALVELNIDLDTITAQEGADLLDDNLNDSNNADEIDDVKEQVVLAILDGFDDIEVEYEVEQVLDSVDIGSDALDILQKNLDGDKNTLRLIADVTTNLPLSVTLVIQVWNGIEYITIPTLEDLAGSLDGYIDTIDDLNTILSDLKFKAKIVVNNYIPGSGDFDLTGKYIYVTFIARKTGSLVF